jgi:hypothetical protein
MKLIDFLERNAGRITTVIITLYIIFIFVFSMNHAKPF